MISRLSDNVCVSAAFFQEVFLTGMKFKEFETKLNRNYLRELVQKKAENQSGHCRQLDSTAAQQNLFCRHDLF